MTAETPPTLPALPTAPAVLQACRALLRPLAELAIARGLQYGEIDELLRAVFVEAALAAHPEVAPSRAVSRVSTATGLHRREVDRLINHGDIATEGKRSPATQVFTRWLSDPALRHNGVLLSSLPRQGSPLSFETLAQAVTKDVHPRSLLEELCRLGLARVDEATDHVVLLRDRFAPAGDESRMLAFLASNVGDHLRASVANVLATEPPHLEQALFADAGSSSSESLNIRFRLKGYSDIVVDVATTLNAGDPPESLLSRKPGVLSALGGLGATLGGIRNIKEGDRKIGDHPGQEWLMKAPNDHGQQAHLFTWEAPGLHADELHPKIRIELQSGNSDGGLDPRPISMTDKQVLELWDRILNSLRLRPTEDGNEIP